MLTLNIDRFQYVSCQFDALRRHRTPAKIRGELRDLPRGLDATYNRMLDRVDPEYEKQVASVLKWLAFSVRPLQLEELAEAFIMDLDTERPITFDESERLFTAEDVLTYLPGLVVKVPVLPPHIPYTARYTRPQGITVYIRFAHFSIKEYLCSARMARKHFSTAEETSHLHISESCLAYHLQLSETTIATPTVCSLEICI